MKDSEILSYSAALGCWFVLTLVDLNLAAWLMSMSSDVLNISGIAAIVLWIVITFKTKFLTRIISIEKNEKS